jgi:hypothetical protein
VRQKERLSFGGKNKKKEASGAWIAAGEAGEAYFF